MFPTVEEEQSPQPQFPICANHAARLKNIETEQSSQNDKLDRLLIFMLSTLATSASGLLILLLTRH